MHEQRNGRWCRLAAGVGLMAMAATAPAQQMSLEDVLRQASDGSRSELQRSRLAVSRAEGSVQQAEGGFDWNLNTGIGYRRLAQPQINAAGSLTDDIEYLNVLTANIGAEKVLANGVRIRPGFTLTQQSGDSRLASAQLKNQAHFELEVPLGQAFGRPPEAIRLAGSQAELAASQADASHGQQTYLRRVMAAAWTVVAAQERQAIDREVSATAKDLSQRMASLASAKEIALMTQDEIMARGALLRATAERGAADLAAAKVELATLLNADPATLQGVEATLPAKLPVPDSARLSELAARVAERRADYRSIADRAESTRLRGELARRESDSQVALVAAHDRLMVNWHQPLGGNRQAGVARQTEADAASAALSLEEAKRRASADVRIAGERLAAIARAADSVAPAAEQLRQRIGLVQQLADRGQVPHVANLDAIEQYANAQRQLIDLRLQHAIALADLRLVSGTIPATADPKGLVQLFSTLP